MEIFKEEIGLGLENNVISYACDVRKSTIVNSSNHIKASHNDMMLYPLESLLCSPGMNLNDDYFSISELWNARFTPEDTPFNLLHQQHQIIGHITSNYIMDRDNNIIPDEIPIDAIPPLFDIWTTAVIYKRWTDAEYEDMINQIIAEIETGDKWHVSMECRFDGFNYAVMKDHEVCQIIPRTPETAFLTKYLRAYQGNGLYDGNRIGRAFKGITFCGKGLVTNPANPTSVIKTVYNTINAEVSEILPEKTNMEDVDIKNALVAMTAERDGLLKQLAESKIQDVSSELDSVKAELETAKALITELSNKLSGSQTENTGLASQIKDLNLKLVKADRASKLVAANVAKEVVDTLPDSVVDLSDEVFDAIVSIASVTVAPKLTSKTDNKLTLPDWIKTISVAKTTPVTEVATASEVVESVEETVTVDTTGSVTETNDQVEVVRASIAEYLTQNFDNKKNKGV